MKHRGRPWDDVYSEIRARLAPRSAVDMHVMQHLWAFVLFARRNARGEEVLVDHYGRSRATLGPDGGLAGRWGRGVFYVSCDSRRLMLATFRRDGSAATDNAVARRGQ
jgi:hypothetical protein